MHAPLYRLDPCRLTLRECWYQTRSASVVIICLLKWLRIRIPVPAMPNPANIHQSPLERDALPGNATTSLDPLVAELEAEGYHSKRYYRYASSRAQIEIFLAALVHPRGIAIARAMYVVSHQSHPPTEKTRVFVLSGFPDGTWLVTSPQRPEFEPCPGVEVLRVLNAPPARLARAHDEALSRRAGTHPLVSLTSVTEAEAMADAYERHAFEHGIRRGLYVPLTEAETTEEEVAVTTTEQARAEVGTEHAEVLLEIDRLQNPKPSLKNALWILGGSLVVFIILGGARWEWEFLLFILPILLVHEAGHWLAMRLFGYRNLRMFFIPLFGAAVSGQNFNVAGWNKALVSLAGPAPGVLMGTALAFASLAIDRPWLGKLALLSVMVNAFNLLPLVPLDGGWFLNATLFCRRAWMETGFKLAAVLALFVAGARTESRLWTGLAILMAFSIGPTWRLGRIAERLRKSGFSARSEDRQTIPHDAAVTLIDAVKASTTRTRPVKMIATETLDVFERLNARPPGILATLGLLAAYAATLAVAFVGTGTAWIARSGGAGLLGDIPAAAESPPFPVGCGEIGTASGAGSWPDPAHRTLVIGILPEAADAASRWSRLVQVSPTRSARVGPMLLAMFPSDATNQVASVNSLLEASVTPAFQRSQESPGSVHFLLTCQPPVGEAGDRLLKELEEYFLLPGSRQAVPPWAAEPALTAEQRHARETWGTLSRMEREVESDPELKSARTQMLRTLRLGDTNQRTGAISNVTALRNRLIEERETRMAPAGNTASDAEIVALKHALRRPKARQEEASATAAGTLLGIVPEDSVEASPSIRALAASGSARIHEGRLELRWLDFREPSTGLPALLEWLCSRNVSDVQVGVRTVSEDPDDSP